VEILNLGGASDDNSSAPKARKKMGVLLGIGALAAVTGLGSTLAANISLNSATGGAVEFGQGVVTTAACDSDGITVTPVSAFDNSVDPAVFNLASIGLTDIDVSGDPAAACSGKTLTIKGYGDTDPTALFTTDVVVDSSSETIDMTTTNPDILATILASDLYKITIESTDTVVAPS
jgi:hypothetical protein